MSPPIPRDESSWSIEELAEKANALLSQSDETTSDSRIAKHLTPRNVRRLQSEGSIDKPAKVGREAYYGPHHLDQLVAARGLMNKGFTASSIQTMRAAADEPAMPAPASSRGSSALYEREASGPQAPSPLATRQSTASALSFLDGLGGQNATGIAAKKSQGPAASSLAVAPPESDRMAKAFATLSPPRGAEPSATRSVELEPFLGLRVSVRSDAATAPLTDEQRRLAIAAIERAWGFALAERGPQDQT